MEESPRWKKTPYMPLLKSKETKFGIDKGSSSDKKYKANFYKLYEKLEELIKDDKNIITHNSWGEYGHPEHIQVHRCVCSLSEKYNFKIHVTGYVSDLSSELMYQSISRISSKKYFYLTDDILFNKIKSIYMKYSCWTWMTEYTPPSNEIFYLLSDHKSFEVNQNKNLQVSNLPLNLLKIRRPSIIQIVADLLLPNKLVKLLQKIKKSLLKF